MTQGTKITHKEPFARLAVEGSTRECKVDWRDAELLRDKTLKYRWAPTMPLGYVIVDSTPLHRWLLDAPEGMDVDHKNGDGFDNRRSNLRLATRSQNLANRRGWSNLTQYKGIRYKPARPGKGPECWEAYVGFEGRKVYAGRARTEVEAARLYNKKALELYGEFALLNDVPEAT